MAIENLKPKIVQMPLPEAAPDLNAVHPESSRYDAERRGDCYYVDDEPDELDVTINDLPEEAISFYSEPEAASPEGVSMPMGQYYANREKMVRAVAKTNSRRGFESKNSTQEGLNETYDRYGVDTPDVVAGASRKVSQIQGEINELFLAEELVAAGFSAEAVENEAEVLKKELEKTFTTNSGMSEDEKRATTNRRAREYRRVENKLKAYGADA